MPKPLIITAVVLLILAGIGLALHTAVAPEQAVTEPERATLTGTHVCLPHKDPIATKECAPGIRIDDGTHYALDFALMSQTPPIVNNGDRFTASGVITPIERLSTDHWQKYDVKGIFSVTDGVSVEQEEPAPAPVVKGKCYVGGCSSQLCTDTPDMASTCEYREAYACYQGQTCERQASGECGWTLTADAVVCLETAN